MKTISYVTTNIDKFNKAKVNLATYNILLLHETLEMDEPQTSDGDKIVRQKAEQAYEYFKKPVLVNDDTWSIPALRGFPGTGMKLCNDFLIAEDWLRLMEGKSDRRIQLVSYFAYHDGKTIQVVSAKDERRILYEVRGIHKKSPCLEVIAHADRTISMAEEIALGRKRDENN
ncbi:MAG: non-canonical purine NTP pyrophosphatase, partial [Candidatus Woesebacteria bacterium]